MTPFVRRSEQMRDEEAEPEEEDVGHREEGAPVRERQGDRQGEEKGRREAHRERVEGRSEEPRGGQPEREEDER